MVSFFKYGFKLRFTFVQKAFFDVNILFFFIISKGSKHCPKEIKCKHDDKFCKDDNLWGVLQSNQFTWLEIFGWCNYFSHLASPSWVGCGCIWVNGCCCIFSWILAEWLLLFDNRNYSRKITVRLIRNYIIL